MLVLCLDVGARSCAQATAFALKGCSRYVKLWRPKLRCHPLVESKVILCYLGCRYHGGDGNILSRLPESVLTHILCFLDDGWVDEEAIVRLEEFGIADRLVDVLKYLV